MFSLFFINFVFCVLPLTISQKVYIMINNFRLFEMRFPYAVERIDCIAKKNI